MPNITSLAPHISGSSFGQVIMDTIADLKIARARRALYNETYRALNDMSDRDLADIGVSRRSIRDIAQKAADTRA